MPGYYSTYTHPDWPRVHVPVSHWCTQLLLLTVISIRHYNRRAFKCSLCGSLLLAASPSPLSGWKVSVPPRYSSGTVVGGHSQKWWRLSCYLLRCSPLTSQTGVLRSEESVFSVTNEALFALYTYLWWTRNLVCSRVSYQFSSFWLGQKLNWFHWSLFITVWDGIRPACTGVKL